MLRRTVVAILVATGCIAAFAGVSMGEDVKSLRPSGFVNDYAGVLPPGTRTVVESWLTQIEQRTGVEIAVVTVNTISPLTVEQYAVELFEKWGIGKSGADNGILVLIAVSERKVRIEVGYGLEGAVTDLKSKMIIEEAMVPLFRMGDYGAGVSNAVVMLSGIISEEYGVELDLGEGARNMNMPRRHKGSALGSFVTLLFFILIFGFRFGTFFFLMSSGGGYWSGGSRGSFGGGFGGFGGGFSGGGGASGSW